MGDTVESLRASVDYHKGVAAAHVAEAEKAKAEAAAARLEVDLYAAEIARLRFALKRIKGQPSAAVALATDALGGG